MTFSRSPRSQVIGLVVLALSLVALVADAQRRPVLEDLGSRRLVIDHGLAPLDARRVEPDGCIFEVARSAERDRLEIRTLIDYDFEHSHERYGVGVGVMGPTLGGVWLLPAMIDECEIRILAVDPRDRGRGAIVPLTLGMAEVLPLVPAAPGASLDTAPWSRVMQGCVDGRSDRCVVYGTWRDVHLATDPRLWSVGPHVASADDDGSDGSRYPAVVQRERGRFRVEIPGPLWQSGGIVATLLDGRTRSAIQRLEVDAHGPSLSLWGAHAQAVAVLRGDRLVAGVMFGGGLALVFDDHGAAHWARVLGARGDDGASEWSLLWAASRCAAQPPAERLCLTPVRGATDDE